MRLTRIYTRTGDKGTTQLANGTKAPKSHIRLECYGGFDELNAHIGLLRSYVCMDSGQEIDLQSLDQSLERIQNELFDLGGELAMPNVEPQAPWLLPSEAPETLEAEIDQMNSHLAPLKNFILPAGSIAVSQGHVARTVCRRIERQLVRAIEQDSSIRPCTLKYLNRLSDWLFVMCRFIAHKEGSQEVLWQQRSRS